MVPPEGDKRHEGNRPRAVLHIGIEKTGTTTLQHFLGVNRRQLLGQGIVYPISACDGAYNQRKLAAYAREDGRFDDLRQSLGIRNQRMLDSFREAFRQELERELRANSHNAHTVIFSNEHCHSRLTSQEEVARLLELIAPMVSDITVVVYLRRQDKLAMSLYSTYLRRGGTRSEVFPGGISDRNAYYNFEQLLERWGSTRGVDNVIPRIYERQEMRNNDVIADFLQAIDCSETARLVRPAQLNQSLRPGAHKRVRAMNERVRLGDSRVGSALRQTIVQVLGAGTDQDDNGLPDRARAKAFFKKFETSNEKVRQRWFPLKESLFTDDFSMYPEPFNR